MEYSPDILERIETLSRRCADKKKVLTDYIGILQTRAELEEYYSRNLEKIGESLTKLIHGKDGLKDVFLTLRNYLQVQSEQSRGFARQIKNDVVADISTLLLQEQNWQRDMANLGKKHQRDVKANVDRLNQLRDEYIIAAQEEMRVRANPGLKPKFLKPRTLCESHLKDYIDKYNEYIEGYFSDMASVQTTFQSIELERRTAVQASAMKYLVFEISLIRNLQYDIGGISSRIEQYNPRSDLIDQFKEAPSAKPMLAKLNFENYRQFINQQINFQPQEARVTQGRPQNKIFDPLPKEKPLKRQIIAAIESNQPTNPLHLKLFQTALFGNVISDQAVDNLKSTMDDESATLMPSALDRILALNQHSENSQVPQRVDAQGYVSLQRIIGVFFDYCNSKNSFGSSVARMSGLLRQIVKSVQVPAEDQQGDKQQEGHEISLFGIIFVQFHGEEGFTSHEVFQNYELWIAFAKQAVAERLKAFRKEQEVAVFSENFIDEEGQAKNCIRLVLKDLVDAGVVDAFKSQIAKDLCDAFQVQQLNILSSNSKQPSQKQLQEDVFQ